MSSYTDLTFQTIVSVDISKEDQELLFKLWPESFIALYETGFKAFEMLFNHRPHLKAEMKLPEDDSWKRDERMKKIVLALVQTLVKAVATFADEDDQESTPEIFTDHLREIGGLHRQIVPSLKVDNFQLLFRLLPEVIADVTSSRPETGPLKAAERKRLVAIWTSITNLMATELIMGWERRIVPKNCPKLSESYRSEKKEGERYCSSSALGNSSAASSDSSGSINGTQRTPSGTRPIRRCTQAEMSVSTSSTPCLERGNSAPIALHDLHLEFQQLTPS